MGNATGFRTYINYKTGKLADVKLVGGKLVAPTGTTWLDFIPPAALPVIAALPVHTYQIHGGEVVAPNTVVEFAAWEHKLLPMMARYIPVTTGRPVGE